MQLASYTVVKFYDELLTLLMIAIAVCDSCINNRWKQYAGLWTVAGVMGFYIIYSLTVVHFNELRYILMDALIESKPYIAFFTFFAIAPRLNDVDKHCIRGLTLGVAGVVTIVMLCGFSVIVAILTHQAVAGATVFLLAMAFWLASTSSNERGDYRNRIMVLTILCAGLLCTRSKYYGYFVIAVFFLFFYNPGILKHFKFKHVLLLAAVAALIIAVSWHKFYFYFVVGSSDIFDPNVQQSFARPVLYATSGLIMWDFLPFGSGLASFATYPSAANYSQLYYEYGLDNIYGLSPEMPDFIMDAFFPTLAQYGIVGVALFIWFWVYAYRPLRFMLRTDSARYKAMFSIGSLIICYVFIESVGNTSFTQPSGQLAMMLLGIICGEGKRLMDADNKQVPTDVNKVKII